MILSIVQGNHPYPRKPGGDPLALLITFVLVASTLGMMMFFNGTLTNYGDDKYAEASAQKVALVRVESPKASGYDHEKVVFVEDIMEAIDINPESVEIYMSGGFPSDATCELFTEDGMRETGKLVLDDMNQGLMPEHGVVLRSTKNRVSLYPVNLHGKIEFIIQDESDNLWVPVVLSKEEKEIHSSEQSLELEEIFRWFLYEIKLRLWDESQFGPIVGTDNPEEAEGITTNDSLTILDTKKGVGVDAGVTVNGTKYGWKGGVKVNVESKFYKEKKE